jgi:hydrogenase expression/formation protein HypC
MCLAVPAKVIEIIDRDACLAKVEIGDVRRNISIAMLDDIEVGDYVLVHVGFAMSKVDERAAEDMLQLLKELGDDV